MLDDFVDVTKDEKRMMHMWNSFVRKQRYVLSLFSEHMMFILTANKFRGACVVGGYSCISSLLNITLTLDFDLLQSISRWSHSMGM